jgi:hypothetical protein
MTLCAAAIAASDGYIVAISDTMVAGATMSSDECTLKMEPFAMEWIAMFAGDDISQCLPVIRRAEKYFHNRANTLANARNALKKAYQQHLIEMKTDAVLSGYGLDMDTFLKSGKRKFTERVFSSICDRLDAIKEIGDGCQFLVFGYDGDGRAHIFSVGAQGADFTYDKPGFCCIGSGGFAADAMLHYFGQAIYRSLPETIFNLCAAKFMAERSGIGRDTFLYLKRPKSVACTNDPVLVDDIRRAWEAEGVPKTPPGILDRIVSADVFKFPRGPG